MRIDTPSSYLDLFSRPAATVPAVADQSDALPDASGEPSTSRALVPLSPPNLPATTGATDLAPELAEAVADADTSGYDLRAISPRDMQELSLDLYAQGLLTFEDYAVLAFQPELHPRFNDTVGALTGETADPTRPRDYVRQWEDRLSFERRHHAENSPLVKQSQRIVALLKGLDDPTDITA